MTVLQGTKITILTSTVVSIGIAIGGLMLIPHVPDLYNEIYYDSRLQRPESTVMFFVTFPILQIFMAAAYLITTKNIGNRELKISHAMFPVLLHCLFTIFQGYRLGAALSHF